MSICIQLTGGFSLTILVFAAYIGFTKKDDTNDPMNKFKGWIDKRLRWVDKILKCNLTQKPYIYTKIGLIIGFCLGIITIALS